MLTRNSSSSTARVAVDAMGGDNAPDEVVRGAVDAHRRGVPVLLVGQRARIEPLLNGAGGEIPVVDAPYAIGMEETMTRGLLREHSSLRLAAELVRSGDADAVVSAGNSAAIMSLALTVWDTLPGIHRPAFGGYMPSRAGGVFVVDIGANPTVKVQNLVQFAVMGEVYVRIIRGIERPSVALLSNGTEVSKGTKETRDAYKELQKIDINFVGNVEGNHIFDGGADVVVCDGFTGNILLKGAEGVVNEIFEFMKQEISKDLVARLGAAAMMPALTRIKRRVDYEEYGGVPVLGVAGLMINCHGRSKAKAITNAILLADRLTRDRLVERISTALHDDDVEAARGSRLARALHLRPTT